MKLPLRQDTLLLAQKPPCDILKMLITLDLNFLIIIYLDKKKKEKL